MSTELSLSQAQKMLKEVEDMLDDEATASRLSFHSHSRLEKIRSFLIHWIANSGTMDVEQQGNMLIELLEALKQTETEVSSRELN